MMQQKYCCDQPHRQKNCYDKQPLLDLLIWTIKNSDQRQPLSARDTDAENVHMELVVKILLMASHVSTHTHDDAEGIVTMVLIINLGAPKPTASIYTQCCADILSATESVQILTASSPI